MMVFRGHYNHNSTQVNILRIIEREENGGLEDRKMDAYERASRLLRDKEERQYDILRRYIDRYK